MKAVGFRLEKDKSIIVNSFINEAIPQAISLEESEKAGVVNYLQNSTRIFAIPLALQDESGNYIDSYKIYTDGDWIWPSHYFYYLKRDGFKNIDIDFLNHLKSTNFITPILSKDKIEVATCFFESEMINLKRKK